MRLYNKNMRPIFIFLEHYVILYIVKTRFKEGLDEDLSATNLYTYILNTVILQ